MGKMERTTAGNVKALVDMCNGNYIEAALAVGYYPSTIGRAIRHNECTIKLDNACKAALAQLAAKYQERKAQLVAQVSVPESIDISAVKQSQNYEFTSACSNDPIMVAVMVPEKQMTAFNKLMAMMGLEPQVI